MTRTDTVHNPNAVRNVRKRVHLDLTNTLHRAAKGLGAEFTDKPVFREPEVHPVPDPLTGLKAARIVGRSAHLLEFGAILHARIAGLDWAQIADGLGIVGETRADAAMAAFEYATDPTDTGERFLIYRCPDCEQLVKDLGPAHAGGHPDDREHRHAPDCARHRAQVAAWQAATPTS